MQVTIIPDDKAVYVDGVAVQIKNFEDLGIASNVHAVVWDSGLKRGEVMYKAPAPTVLDETTFNAQFLHCVAHHENVGMDLKEAEERRRLEDEAHSKRVEALAKEREAKEASTADKLAKANADIDALKRQVAKLTAGKA